MRGHNRVTRNINNTECFYKDKTNVWRISNHKEIVENLILCYFGHLVLLEGYSVQGRSLIGTKSSH